MKKGVKYTLATLGVAACLLLGSAAKDNLFNVGKNFEVLANMLRAISTFYVDKVDSDRVLVAAAEGMTNILDPYTVYIPSEEMDAFEQMTTGKYGGVGSLIRLRGDYVEFSLPYKDSPADRAGIRPGDRIVAIEGESAKGYTTDKVSSLLKGDAGTDVHITVEKFPTNEPQELTITRERIAIPGIPYYGMVAEGVGYINHSDFTDACSADFRKAYEELKALGATSVVLDYRSNGGGLLKEAVEILSFFLPEGSEVVSTRSENEPTESITTKSAPIDETTPLVVLVDNSSASAAEIVSGALQDYDRAVLVGQRTYGKGLVQTTIPMGYNSYMKMTTSKYHLPSGRCIQAIDYAAHNGEGSVRTVPDSLIKEFRTSLGRKVYDGGGVMPDVKVEPEYVSSFAVVVYAQGFVDDFLTEYCKRHYEELEGAVVPTEYHFSDEGYEEFVAFMADKTVVWESYANRLWREFKKAAEKERWEESMTSEMAEIERKITNDTQDNLHLYKNELQKVIENQIVSRYCYSEGASAHMLRDDDELAVAIELLQNPERYNTIRTSKDTEKN